jgi:hypothetical protein
MFRPAVTFALVTLSQIVCNPAVMAAEPGQPSRPSPSAAPPAAAQPAAPAPSATAPAAAPSNDRITAAIIVRELKALGHSADVDTDDSGDPRVNMSIDGFNWSIYFYDCAAGARDERQCVSYQFYSGYTLKQAASLDVINKWNTEQRYAKAYTYVQRNGSHSARIEIDVRSGGTGADPARTFRIHFNIMKDKVAQFRKIVGVR